MNIGSKIRTERMNYGITQEELAEKLNVTRQSVSNWENGRSYPDILSVVRISEIFSMSLDELIKEDEKMLVHLEENTNSAKRNSTVIRLIEISVFLLVWIGCVLAYCIAGAKADDTFLFSMNNVIMLIIMPLTYLLLSAFSGMNDSCGKLKISIPFVFGILNVLLLVIANYTYNGYSAVMSMFSIHRLSIVFGTFSIGIAVSCIGLIIGGAVKKFNLKKTGAKVTE